MSLHTWYKSSPRLRALWRRTKNDLTYWPARGALALLRALPLRLALALGEAVGAAAYAVMPSLRRLSDTHLQIAFGDSLTASDRRRIARRSVMNMGRVFCEVAKFDAIFDRIDDYVEVESAERVERILAEGRGAIAVTGHIGNWEILAAYFARRHGVYAVARRIYDERLNQLLIDFRTSYGVHPILRENTSAAREILAALKGGNLLAMLIDQDTHAPSVSVPFFGRPARTPVAPATLALRSKVPVVAAFIERREKGGYRIRVGEPFALPDTGDRLEDIRQLATAFNRAIEEQIRGNPEEWVWWHERWRRAPVPRLDLDA